MVNLPAEIGFQEEETVVISPENVVMSPTDLVDLSNMFLMND